MISFASVCTGIGGFDLAFEQAGMEPLWFCEIEDNPSFILNYHWPKILNHHDLTQIQSKLVTRPDVLAGGTPCFSSDTLVLTDYGLIEIKDIKVGDNVLTHKNRWKKVVKTFCRESETVTIKGQGHYGLETTSEHPFYASKVTPKWNNDLRMYKRSFGDLEWIKAGEMKGRMWTSPRSVPNVFPQLGLTKELCWLLGCWVGDGWVRDSKRPGRNLSWGQIMICTNKAHSDFLAQKIKDAGLHGCRSEERTTTRFQISNKKLSEWITENFGRGCLGKVIPTWMLAESYENRKAFFEGYVWADGSTRGDLVRLASINKKLIFGAKLLAQTIGYACTVSRIKKKIQTVIEGRTVSQHPVQYGLQCSLNPRSAVVRDDVVMGLVRSVNLGIQQTVYNIEVQDDNSYTADGIIVHNCQGWSVAGDRLCSEDERSKLAFHFIRLCDELNPRVIVWENVPGVLNTPDNSFGCFLAVLAGHSSPLVPPRAVTRWNGEKFSWTDAGMVVGPKRSVAWRVLDSQYFGLAQRRERVFVVASPRGSGFDPSQALFESPCLQRHTPSRKEKREDIAGTLGGGAGTGGWGGDLDRQGAFVAGTLQAETFNRGGNSDGAAAGHLVCGTLKASQCGPGSNVEAAATNQYIPTISNSLTTQYGKGAEKHEQGAAQRLICQTAFPDADTAPCLQERDAKGNDSSCDKAIITVKTSQTGSNGRNVNEEGLAYTLDQANQAIGLKTGVRRLTVVECARLSGFPDDWCFHGINRKGKQVKISDSAQYKAYGNCVNVPVARWIAKRIVNLLTLE